MADVKFRTVSATLNTVTGTQDITISGFGTPVGVIAIYGGTTDGATRTDGAVFGFGFSDGTNSYTTCVSSDDGVSPSVTKRIQTNLRLIHLLQDNGLNDAVVSFDSFISDGVRIDIVGAPAQSRQVTFVFIGGSDVTNSKTGNVDLGTGTSPIDVNTIGFNPDLVFVLSNGQGGYGTSSDTESLLSVGIAHNDGSDTQAAIGIRDRHNITTSEADTVISNTCVMFDPSGGVVSKKVTIGSFDASGFSVTPSANFAGDELTYFALKFANTPSISLDFIDSPTSTGSYSTTAPAITPDFAIGLLSNASAYESSPGDSVAISAFDATNQYCLAYSSQDSVNPSNAASKYAANPISDLKAGTTDNGEATFTSFDANGFTLNYPTTAPTSINKWAFLTIGPGSVSYTLTADAGAITATGQSANLIAPGTQTTSTVNLGVPSGYNKTVLSGTITADGNFTVQPVANDQILAPNGVTVDAQLNITGSAGTYVLYHIIASTGVTYHTSYIIADPGNFTDTIDLSAGATYTTATLETGFDPYVFEGWTPQPVVGEQITTITDEGYFDTLGNYYSEVEIIHDAWFTALDGTTTHFTIDGTGLSTPIDSTPDTFAFAPVVGQQLNTVITSQPIRVLGVTAATNIPITISAGSEYQVSTDGVTYGAWTSLTGNVQLNNYVKIRQTTSGSYSTLTKATLNIGGVTADWDATTVIADTTPDDFSFPTVTGAARNTLIQSQSISVLGVVANYDVSISITGGEYSYSTDNGLTYSSWTSSNGNVRLGYLVRLRLTSSGNYSDQKSATVTIGGVSESFIVTTVSQADDITPDSFAFTDLIDQTPADLVESESKQVTGLTPASNIAVTVSNGEYAISSDNITFSSFTSLAGNIQNGQYIKLRQTTSADYYVKKSTVLTVGTFSTTWSTTTVSLSVPQFNVTDPNVTVERFYGDSFRIRALKNYDNWVKFECYNAEALMNLSNATDFELKLTNAAGTTYSLLRSTSPNYFTIRPTLGIVEVMVGMSSAPVGDYLVDLIYFDALHTNGAVLTANRQIVLDLV